MPKQERLSPSVPLSDTIFEAAIERGFLTEDDVGSIKRHPDYYEELIPPCIRSQIEKAQALKNASGN